MMQYRRFGPRELLVSEICPASMIWGEHNSETEAHDQLDCAPSRGVDCIDAADMYPVPWGHQHDQFKQNIDSVEGSLNGAAFAVIEGILVRYPYPAW